jgi:hypothetical protein
MRKENAMSPKSRIAIAALLGCLAAPAAFQAQAADIQVVTATHLRIHPYFRSNCWDPAFTVAKPRDWVSFGTISGHAEFTWSPFELLLKANCKHPTVTFTYNLDGEPEPTGRGQRERTTKLMFDASVPVYSITVGDVSWTQITGVTPSDDRDDD